MSHDLESVEGRLQNIEKVKPILAALRTISLGSWQMARRRRLGLQPYTQRLLELLPFLVPEVVKAQRPPRLWSRVSSRFHSPFRLPFPKKGRGEDGASSAGQEVIAVILGSERGLVGRYNKILLARFESYMEERDAAGEQVKLAVMGSRIERELVSAGYEPAWARELSLTSLPSYEVADELTREWLEGYEAYDLSAVDIIYNAARGAATYAPEVMRLIPPELPDGALAPERVDGDDEDGAPEGWGERVIIETDPVSLYVRVVQEWTATAMYRLLLEAALTEHAARYQLMESATQNADAIIDELTLTVQSARRRAITQQMQELAAGAGLLREDDGP